MREQQGWLKRTFRAMFAEPNLPSENEPRNIVKVIHSKEQGSSGTEVFSGYPNEEYLNALKGNRRADEFDKMRRSDTTVMMLLLAVKNLIRSAVWTVQPGDDSEEAKQDAELIEQVLFKDLDWDQYITEALTACEFGVSVFERTHKIFYGKKFGSYVGLKNMGWRSPKTLERWNLNPEDGTLKSVTQLAHGDLNRYIDMDARFLTVISLNREGSNYEGISMLRPLYGAYKRKNVYLKLNAIGIEKFAIPTPVAEIPEVDLSGEQYDNLIEALENFVGHESQYITHPTGWKVTLVNNTYDPEKVEKSIDAEDRRMVNAFVANFLNLGQGSAGGSYALSNDLSDFFTAGLDYIAKIIIADINKTIIPELIGMNKGERETYPKITHTGISDKAGKELAEILQILTGSRVVIADDRLEKFAREKYKLPQASAEGQRQQQNQQQSPFAPLPMSENSILNRIRAAEKRRIS